MAAFSPLAAGAALKLEANKIAEIEISATERVIWSAEAPLKFLCRFFIEKGARLTRCEFCSSQDDDLARQAIYLSSTKTAGCLSTSFAFAALAAPARRRNIGHVAGTPLGSAPRKGGSP
jgi:hypothetical protein